MAVEPSQIDQAFITRALEKVTQVEDKQTKKMGYPAAQLETAITAEFETQLKMAITLQGAAPAQNDLLFSEAQKAFREPLKEMLKKANPQGHDTITLEELKSAGYKEPAPYTPDVNLGIYDVKDLPIYRNAQGQNVVTAKDAFAFLSARIDSADKNKDGKLTNGEIIALSNTFQLGDNFIHEVLTKSNFVAPALPAGKEHPVFTKKSGGFTIDLMPKSSTVELNNVAGLKAVVNNQIALNDANHDGYLNLQELAALRNSLAKIGNGVNEDIERAGFVPHVVPPSVQPIAPVKKGKSF